MYSRIPCITAQNTAEYMYPAFKINKDFEWGMWKLLLQKMATQSWQNLNLKKRNNRTYIRTYITVIMRFGFENLYKKKSGW